MKETKWPEPHERPGPYDDDSCEHSRIKLISAFLNAPDEVAVIFKCKDCHATSTCQWELELNDWEEEE